MKLIKQNLTENTQTIIQRAAQWPLWIYSIAIWLVIVFALRNQRAYQDSWVLEDIVFVVLFLVLSFIVAAVNEKNGNRLALLATSFVIVLRWIPGLKYVWAYGVAIDQAVHVTNTEYVIRTGFPPLETVYSNVPGMHILLGGIALGSGTTVEEVFKYGFPILMGLIPLIIYFFCCQVQFKPLLRNQIVIASVLVFDPYVLVVQGSPFGTLLLAITVYLFISREFSSTHMKLAITPILMSAAIALTFSHSVTAIILIFLLIISGGLLHFTSVVSIDNLKLTSKSANRFLLIMIVVCLSWWMYQAQGIFNIFVKQIGVYLTQAQGEKAPIPSRAFQLPFEDLFTVLGMLHANIIIMLLLSAAGLAIYWRYRHTEFKQFQNLLMILFTIELALGIVLIGQLARGFGSIEYLRLMAYATILSPFFVGITLSSLKKWNNYAWGLSLSIIFFISFMQVFPYQPWIPTGDSLQLDSSTLENKSDESGVEEISFSDVYTENLVEYSMDEEPLVYLHTVMTNHKISLLTFTKDHISPNIRILTNSVLRSAAYRFWGTDFFKQNPVGLIGPSVPLDSVDNWQIYLLHHAGIAGPLGEQLEFRSRGVINRFISENGNSLIYNNGEAFILLKK